MCTYGMEERLKWEEHTAILPVMSLLTGLKAALPKTSNRPVRASEASRNSEVEMALSLLASMGTSTKERLPLSKYVPPGGYAIGSGVGEGNKSGG